METRLFHVLKNKIYEFVHDEFVHDMETVSALLALCVVNLPVDSQHKGPVMQRFDVSLLLA